MCNGGSVVNQPALLESNLMSKGRVPTQNLKLKSWKIIYEKAFLLLHFMSISLITSYENFSSLVLFKVTFLVLFQASKTAFCGNGIKEEGEECDCGYASDCNDQCCYGRDSVEGEQCTLRLNITAGLRRSRRHKVMCR